MRQVIRRQGELSTVSEERMSDFVTQQLEHIVNHVRCLPSAKIVRHSRLECRKIELPANIEDAFQPLLDLRRVVGNISSGAV